MDSNKKKVESTGNEIVRLNVGGKVFYTTRTTLQIEKGPNYFSALLSGKHKPLLDENGYYFIDRSGRLFEPILEYLRTGEWKFWGDINPRDVFKEAEFYCIDPTVGPCVTDVGLKACMERNQSLKFNLKPLADSVVNAFSNLTNSGSDKLFCYFVLSKKHVRDKLTEWRQRYSPLWGNVDGMSELLINAVSLKERFEFLQTNCGMLQDYLKRNNNITCQVHSKFIYVYSLEGHYTFATSPLRSHNIQASFQWGILFEWTGWSG